MEAVQTTNTSIADEIWAILKENAIGMKELKARQEETARRMEETDRRIEETARQIEETDRQMKEYNKRFGEFTNRFGEVVEYMIAPNLCDKFDEYGYDFETASSNYRRKDRKNNISFQVDVMLENGDKAMLIEIKTKLETADVKEHIERLEKMRKYADLHGDKRTFLGAVAGVIIEDQVKEYALTEGLFIIEPSGESFNITKPKNKPKEW
jgi:chromosome segregation ATPase